MMESKKLLVVLAFIFTVVNGGLVLASNEQNKTIFSAFGTEDPDPDLDGVYSSDDKCSSTPFSFIIMNTYNKKEKNVTPSQAIFNDPSDATKSVYAHLKQVTTKKGSTPAAIVFQTSADSNFKSGVKEYSLAPDKVTPIDTIGKRFRVVYNNSSRGFAVVWVAGKALTGSNQKGCSVDDLHNSGSITPP